MFTHNLYKKYYPINTYSELNLILRDNYTQIADELRELMLETQYALSRSEGSFNKKDISLERKGDEISKIYIKITGYENLTIDEMNFVLKELNHFHKHRFVTIASISILFVAIFIFFILTNYF